MLSSIVTNDCLFISLQRATLAESEVHSLKEQLENFKVQSSKESLNNNNNNNQSNNNNNSSNNNTTPTSASNTNSHHNDVDDSVNSSSISGGGKEGDEGSNTMEAEQNEDESNQNSPSEKERKSPSSEGRRNFKDQFDQVSSQQVQLYGSTAGLAIERQLWEETTSVATVVRWKW